METGLSVSNPIVAKSITPPVKSKHTGLIIGLGAGALVLGTGVFFLFLKKDDNGTTKFQNWRNKSNAKDETQQAQDVKDQVSQGIPAPSAVSGFPIEANTHNANTKNLQNALMNVWGKKISGAPSDYLGKNTLTALNAIGYDAPVSQADYTNILAHKAKPAPVASGGGSNFSQVQKTLSGIGGVNQKDGVLVKMQGQNTNYQFYFYTNGRMGVSPASTQKWTMGKYSNGGSTIVMDNGNTYQKGGVSSNMLAILRDIEN